MGIVEGMRDEYMNRPEVGLCSFDSQREILCFIKDVGGSDNLMILANTCGHIVRGTTPEGGSDLMIERKPSEYPVLRRNVESRTISADDISCKSRSAHKDGRARITASSEKERLESLQHSEIC
jgi:hypothetical protein